MSPEVTVRSDTFPNVWVILKIIYMGAVFDEKEEKSVQYLLRGCLQGQTLQCLSNLEYVNDVPLMGLLRFPHSNILS